MSVRLLLIAPCLLALSLPTHASTIYASVFASGDIYDNGFAYFDTSDRSGADAYNGYSHASARADVTAGSIASSASSWTCDPGDPYCFSNSGGGDIWVSETFVLNGTGVMSVVMSTRETGTGGGINGAASVMIGAPGSRSRSAPWDTRTGTEHTVVANGQTIKHHAPVELTHRFENAVNQEITVTWRQEFVILDLGATGSLSSLFYVHTNQSLTAAATNANFLRSATPISPVPLPASGLALLAALGALTLRKRRRG